MCTRAVAMHTKAPLVAYQRTTTEVGGRGGLKWSGCIVCIRLWPRLPHGCHRLLSILPMLGALTVRDVSRGQPSLLLPLSVLAIWALPGYACILISGHSLPVLLGWLAPFGHTWLDFVWAWG